jgi:photoactive yellow protein
MNFNDPELLVQLNRSDATALDTLDFGVIGFDAQTVVQRYNTFEAKMANMSVQRVLGRPLFTVVAPCMNNLMVARRFEDAAAQGVGLDAVIDYVLTLGMRPLKLKLRLLAMPADATRYVLLQRPG